MLRMAGKVTRSLWPVVTPVITLALATLFLATSGELNGLEATYPRALAVLVALLAIISIWRDAVGMHRTRVAEPAENRTDDAEPAARGPEDHHRAGRVLGLVAVLAVTTWLMGVIGFFPAAALLLLGGLLILGVRTPLTVVAYTVGIVALAYLLFVEALGVPFPDPWS
jgi:putative tricarboxylic transport membrane protein